MSANHVNSTTKMTSHRNTVFAGRHCYSLNKHLIYECSVLIPTVTIVLYTSLEKTTGDNHYTILCEKDLCGSHHISLFICCKYREIIPNEEA